MAAVKVVLPPPLAILKRRIPGPAESPLQEPPLPAQQLEPLPSMAALADLQALDVAADLS